MKSKGKKMFNNNKKLFFSNEILNPCENCLYTEKVLIINFPRCRLSANSITATVNKAKHLSSFLKCPGNSNSFHLYTRSLIFNKFFRSSIQEKEKKITIFKKRFNVEFFSYFSNIIITFEIMYNSAFSSFQPIYIFKWIIFIRFIIM